ncbi:MAG: protein translocase subunit SecD [Deltaproteobacteria bacterium]|nr:protein translocase subunit SecD [Deltaproteobacteria bacterium]
MTPNWRFRIFSFLIVSILAIYLLIPSILNFGEQIDAAETKVEKAALEGKKLNKDDLLPAYIKLFPDIRVKLALDLQGGVYVELDVELDAALRQRSQVVALRLENDFEQQKIAFEKVSVLPKSPAISLSFKDNKQLEAAKKRANELYGDFWSLNETGPILKFQLKDETTQSVQELFEKIRQSYQSTQNDENNKQLRNLLDIQVFAESKQIQFTFSNSDRNSSNQEQILADFGNELQSVEIKNHLFIQQQPEYQEVIKQDTLAQAVETVRRRIDRFGVVEPTIQQVGTNRIAIAMPGEKDPDKLIEKIKQAGKLEFKLVDSSSIKQQELETLVNSTLEELKLKDVYSDSNIKKINEKLKGKIPADSEIAFQSTYDTVKKRRSLGTPYLLKSKVQVSGVNLANASVNVDLNEPYVSLSFNEEGKEAFAKVTRENVGKNLAILLDGEVRSAPQIQTAIENGEAKITLNQSSYELANQEAKELVAVLKEGSLPTTLTPSNKRYIGPSLGEVSIQKGVNAILFAAAIVFLFMLLWYRKAGLIADIALLVNVLLIFLILLLVGRSLSLAGFAGIVLTIGMAVDANIIILERIKEELAEGKSVKAAIEAGYGNAMSAIVDANLTTFLAGVVLYQFGRDTIQGFAITLMVGIVTTLLTAVVFTRAIYDYLIMQKGIKKLSL